MSDSFQRPISYLRISVTDRCNLRCTYCMPPEGVTLIPHSDVLRYEEILSIVRIAASMGITKVRLSGGEPLVRAGLVDFVRMLAEVREIEDLSLTTNGVLLKDYAAALKNAGLQRVNVSLDSLKRQRFREITGYDRLQDVLEGITEARRAGIAPIKVNVVVMRGINDDELLDFARLTADGWNVRFIELMPILNGGAKQPEFVPANEMWDILSQLGKLEPCSPLMGNGPASYYRLPGARGTIGFITPVSDHFCFKCNRLRLTADGKLLPCLLSSEEFDLRAPLRAGASPADISQLLLKAIAAKPAGHRVSQGVVSQRRPMTQVGG
ncbi:MAG: GTP 3',8-cyclase MoaA [Dehalococcoidia bacterium]|nr:GTP 3',8-cyclase MoaA [Dehalococcoidia bacterium]